MADPNPLGLRRGEVITDPNAGVRGPVSAPGGFSGGVLRTGRPAAEAYKWRCPICGNEYATPLEAGCPQCKDLPQMQPLTELEEGALKGRVLRVPDGVHAPRSIRAEGLTTRARRSLMRALAFYAEAAALHADELTRQEALSWARLLNQADAEDESRLAAQTKTEETPT